jgi:hypothetical protein
MTRGRPVSTVPTWECHVHLRLRVCEDDDLIAFLSRLPPRKRTTAFKAALRAGGMRLGQVDADSSEDELLATIDDFLK